MMKKWSIGLAILGILLVMLSLSSLAVTVVEAPGGVVTTYEELFAALGGDDAGKLVRVSDEDSTSKISHLLLLSDICLAAPVEIAEGDYVIIGAGVEITASFVEGSFFLVGSDKEATLSLGASQTQANHENIVFQGGKQTRKGSFLSIGEKGVVSIFTGMSFVDHTTEMGGGAIHNDGALAMYGGIMENCRSMGAGGAIHSRGTVVLASGNITECSAEFGGALYSEGKASLAGTEITKCTATKGGAIFNANELEYVSSSLSGCRATQGGGLYNSGIAQLKGGQIINCLADDGDGGALYNTGTVKLGETYLNENSAKNGGAVYNAADLTITDGQLFRSIASAAGGHIYNDKTAVLVLESGYIAQGKAKLGGGIYNLGSLTISGGSVYGNKADIGQAILNHGRLYLKTSARIDENNDIFVVVTGENPASVVLLSEMKAACVAVLTPGSCVDGNYAFDYRDGLVLLTGEYVKTEYTRFVVKSDNGTEWLLTEDGCLGKQLPVYYRPWFYVILVGAFVVLVVGMVMGIRFVDKGKGRRVS